MKKYFNKNNDGFTLVEVILYVAIVSLLITSLVSFLWDVIYGRVKSYVHQEVNQNVRLASKRILFEIRNASSINSVSGSNLSLSMEDSGRNPTVISVADGRLKIGFGNSGVCPVSLPCNLTSNQVNVDSLVFTNLSSGLSENIKYSLTISSKTDIQELSKTETYESSGEIRSN